jgi:hypothetical protein
MAFFLFQNVSFPIESIVEYYIPEEGLLLARKAALLLDFHPKAGCSIGAGL